jgi:hypothetical protein
MTFAPRIPGYGVANVKSMPLNLPQLHPFDLAHDHEVGEGSDQRIGADENQRAAE